MTDEDKTPKPAVKKKLSPTPKVPPDPLQAAKARRAKAREREAVERAAARKEADEQEVAEAEAPEIPVIDQLLALAGQLSPEERQKLAESGVVMPLATSVGIEKIYGYRCAHCNEVAIHFVGRNFLTPGGKHLDGAPVGLRPLDTPWTASRPHSMSTERVSPVCPRCKGVLYMPGGRWHKKMMVTIDEWETARDKAYEGIRARRNSPKDTRSLVNPDGTTIDLNDAAATRMPRDIVDPGERAALSEYADDTHLAKILMPGG